MANFSLTTDLIWGGISEAYKASTSNTFSNWAVKWANHDAAWSCCDPFNHIGWRLTQIDGEDDRADHVMG